nr:DUF3363 domain-containing protein [Novosphingobium endophyticum]
MLWRLILDRHVGASVSGLMRGDGVSWSFGRGRSRPGISRTRDRLIRYRRGCASPCVGRPADTLAPSTVRANR